MSITDPDIKERLINCLLFSRHFMSVLEKKTPDFIDYSQSKKSVQ
jgi:hypothetical protein